MRVIVIILTFCSNVCAAQHWMADITAGAAGYNGDLTEKRFVLSRIRPTLGVGLRYNSGDLANFRFGISWSRVMAHDKFNEEPTLVSRNLSFYSNILEASACIEINLLDPSDYTSYPYIIAGVGLFHFNPFAFDKDDKKVFLRPLSTEGQGLADYPDRKPYSKVQFCIPFGVGMKFITKEKWELSYEFIYRKTSTDYLDDVSKRYVSLEVLGTQKGQKAVEMAYRRNVPFSELGEVRGNSEVKDSYFTTGFKLAVRLGTKNNKAK